jgi:hypothetical protein
VTTRLTPILTAYFASRKRYCVTASAVDPDGSPAKVMSVRISGLPRPTHIGALTLGMKFASNASKAATSVSPISKNMAGDTAFASFIHFTCFWTRSCGELAREAGVDFSVAEDVTFFEKSNPDPTETGCELGVPRGELQTKRFTLHRRHFAASFAARRKLAETCRFRLVSYPEPSALSFIDEYHYRAESQSLIAERLAEQIV